MTIDYSALLYDPLYAELGVDAVLTATGTAGEIALTVIDKTKGQPFADAGGVVHSIRPACAVRVNELMAAGVALAEVDAGMIAFNGKTWNVESHELVPAPTGEAQGEVYLWLMES